MRSPKGPVAPHAGMIGRAIECSWLAAVVMVPLAIVNEHWMLGSVETPKVFVLRSIALLMLCLVSLEPLTKKRYEGSEAAGPLTKTQRLKLREYPGRLVFIAASAVLGINVLSTLFSPVMAVSLMGDDVGMDSYGLFNVACYVLVFWVIATHLKSPEQVKRLLWAIVGTGILMSVVGLGQQYGVDPFHDGDRWRSRIPLTVGNPIFAGSLLVMTIPITIGMGLSLRGQIGSKAHVAMCIALLAPQSLSLLFTYSRGAWVGLAFGVMALLAALWFIAGWRALQRPVALLVILFALIAAAASSSPDTGKELTARLSTLAPSVGEMDTSALGSRIQIWESSISAYFGGPWPNQRETSIPQVAPGILRELVGFGPDMYQYANFAAGGPWFTEHAHNFLLHTAIELGSLGVAAYIGLALAILALMYRMLRVAKSRETPVWYTFCAAGFAGTVVGRLIEQMVGKAQIADLTVSWIMAATVVAMMAIPVGSDSSKQMKPMPSVRRQQETDQRGPKGSGGKLIVRDATIKKLGVALVIMGAGFFWWNAVAQPAAAAVAGAEAVEQGNRGLSQPAIAGYSRGIRLAPNLALNHIGLAYVRWNLASAESDLERRMSLLKDAVEQLDRVLDRNPLDYRARRIQVEIMTEIVKLDPANWDTALQAVRILGALQPDYWGPQIQLAKLSLAIGDAGTARIIRDQARKRYPIDATTGQLRIAIEQLDAILGQ